MGEPEVAVQERGDMLREEVKALLASPAGLKLVEGTVVEFEPKT